MLFNTSTGLDLRLKRVSAGVAQVVVAAAMGVSRSRIQAIEEALRPTRNARRRYLAALEHAVATREAEA